MDVSYFHRDGCRVRRVSALVTLIAYASTLALTACGGGTSSPVSSTTTATTSSMKTIASSALSGQALQAQLTADAHAINKLVKIAASAGEGAATRVTITLPAEATTQGMRAMLNGRDVSARFQTTSCAGSTCLEADFGNADGLNSSKNVLYAVAHDAAGAPLTGRLRFAPAVPAAQAKVMSVAAVGTAKNGSALAQSLPTASSFMPPSLPFQTLNAGGPASGQNWLQIGSQVIPTSCDGSATYIAVVLDRQTLVQKPITNNGCFANGADLASTLRTLGTGDLAIVGTTWEHNADSQLDTSAIGGMNYTNVTPAAGAALGYMAIGVGGASLGTAYESRYTSKTDKQFNPFANGILLEDVNGYYNFTATNQGPLEYAVTPNDSSYAGLTTLRISTIDSGTLAKTARVYSPPQPPVGSGGFWLMQFHRNDMSDTGTCASGAALATIGPNDVAYPACGTFYETGASDLTRAQQEATRMTTDLGNIGYQNIIALTTVGKPFQPSDFWTITTNILSSGPSLTPNLMLLGAPTHALQLLDQPDSAFTLISSRDTYIENPAGSAANSARPNFRESMNGDAVVSTTALGPTNGHGLTDQGQTGAVRGVLLPDQHGLYEPSISTQAGDSSGGTDLSFHEISMSTPVEWPELTKVLFNGETTLEGQRGAYAYLSYFLLTNYYLPGFNGPYTNDIHYFYTGGLNSRLDVALEDPLRVQMPTGGTWHDPVANVDVTFTSADMVYVALQIKQELQALANVLAFMSTGSRNVKDIVAGGQNSAALALISAAARIEASTINPPTSTPAQLNYSDFLNFFGGITSIATTIAGAALPEGAVITKAVSVLGGIVSGSLWSGGSLGFSTPGTPPSAADMPNAQRTFLVTIGDLANGQMQSQMAANFDVTIDLITSDYNRLMATNSKILDSGPDGWYAARANGEAAAATLMGKAAERSFYLSLLPSVGYWVDAWPQLGGTVNTDVGGSYGGIESPHCVPFYPEIANMPTDSVAGFPAAGAGSNLYDVFVLGGLVKNGGSSKYSENLPGADLSEYLFDPSGLAIPTLLFFDFGGPVQSRSGPGFTGFASGNTCYPSQLPNVAGSSPQPGDTQITLNAPTAVVADGTVTLTAHTTAAGNASTTGATVLFTDGGKALGTATVDQNGIATLTVTLGMGAHSLDADFVDNGTLRASSADPVATTGYPGPADFTLQVSNDDLSTDPQAPVQVQIGSQNGFAGTVKFSCTGLPEGMECQFNADSISVDTSGGSTTLKIVPKGQASTALAPSGTDPAHAALAAMMLPLLGLRRRARKARHPGRLLAAALVPMALTVALTGCGGGGSSGGDTGATETKTVLVTATDGKTTHSIPIKVTVPK